MTTPYQRRRDPVPFTPGWEIAFGAVAITLLVVALGALLGVGLASLLFGRGWVWPPSLSDVGPVLGGFLTGDPARGYPPHVARLIAPPAAGYASIAVCDAVLVGALAWLALQVTRRFRNDGMATRWEAREALGLRTLRDAMAIIRPDLVAGARRERRP